MAHLGGRLPLLPVGTPQLQFLRVHFRHLRLDRADLGMPLNVDNEGEREGERGGRVRVESSQPALCAKRETGGTYINPSQIVLYQDLKCAIMTLYVHRHDADDRAGRVHSPAFDFDRMLPVWPTPMSTSGTYTAV